ncbi:DUF685 domain-containing protein [Candidatus Borreliella tachyglossi]|uniref:DUF685 domain-containing protein n=1 Tax=Candidatus Borreliella tachyglossi TaxID=1964448 RepID=UPI00404159C5
MSNNESDTEECIQIKDFNRKIKVNQNDLIPIDDVVEETYAITYKNLLEQIKQDTFYEGLDYFKKVIREIISKELLEDASYTEKMYCKVISKLIGLQTVPSHIDFNMLSNKIKETLISGLNHSGYDAKLGKISIYNPIKRDFELVEFQNFINTLKKIFTENIKLEQLREYSNKTFAENTKLEQLREYSNKTFAENTKLEQLREYSNNTFAKIDSVQAIHNSLPQTYIKKINMSDELNLSINSTSKGTMQDDLQLLAFDPKKKSIHRLDFPNYLKGMPSSFQYWKELKKSDTMYYYYEFKDNPLIATMRSEDLELRFPRSMKNTVVYLDITIRADEFPETSKIVAKSILIRFSENKATSYEQLYYHFKGFTQQTKQQIFHGWYMIKSSIHYNDPDKDVPYLVKM